MDPISLEAISRLGSAVKSLLPAEPDPAFAPDVTIQPLGVTETGLGGFVGFNPDPAGEILGRRVEATALIRVKASPGGIEEAVSKVTGALLVADRATLLSKGILRLTLDALGEVSSPPGGPLTQQAGFRVLFEYLKTPEAADGIIRTVPVNIQLQKS